jgi:hypothetical protein
VVLKAVRPNLELSYVDEGFFYQAKVPVLKVLVPTCLNITNKEGEKKNTQEKKKKKKKNKPNPISLVQHRHTKWPFFGP